MKNENNEESKKNSNKKREPGTQLSKEELELQKQQKQQLKEAKKQNKINKKERKLARHSIGKYYFWEWNTNNVPKNRKTKIFSMIGVSFAFGLSTILANTFAISATPQLWNLLLLLLPIFIILWAIADYFIESKATNTKNRNIGLMLQRFGSLMYLLLMFSYALIVSLVYKYAADKGSSIITDGNIGQLEIPVWMLINLIASWILVVLLNLEIIFNGNTREYSRWPNDFKKELGIKLYSQTLDGVKLNELITKQYKNWPREYKHEVEIQYKIFINNSDFENKKKNKKNVQDVQDVKDIQD